MTVAEKNALVDTMHELHFGVEVEMNNISRAKAAQVAARYFGGTQVRGPASDGYSTMRVSDTHGRIWKFMYDGSIAGPSEERCEMVTPILSYEDMEELQGLVRELRHAGAKSSPSRGCGVHIHVDARGMTPLMLRNLTNIMASHERLLIDAIAVDRDREYSYCRTVNPLFLQAVNERKPATMSELADIWYTANGATYGRNAHYNPSRYHMLNLHATFTKGTVEFRLFQFDEPDPATGRKGGLHAGQLKAYIQLCLMMCAHARRASRASCTPVQMENKKFAMRAWISRLGMNGPEFETMREVLTKRLDGNAAFRFAVA